MVEDTMFYGALGSFGGFLMFMLHKVYTLGGRVSGLEATFETQKKEISCMSSKLSSVHSKITTISEDMREVKTIIKNIDKFVPSGNKNT